MSEPIYLWAALDDDGKRTVLCWGDTGWTRFDGKWEVHAKETGCEVSVLEIPGRVSDLQPGEGPIRVELTSVRSF